MSWLMFSCLGRLIFNSVRILQEWLSVVPGKLTVAD